MMTPSLVIKRILPEVDERIWIMILAIAVFAASSLKELTLPTPVTLITLALVAAAILIARGKQPEVPLYLLIAYLPFNRLLNGAFSTPIPTVNLVNLLIVLVFVTHVWRQVSNGNPVFVSTPLDLIITAFVGLILVSLLRGGWIYGDWYPAQHAMSFIRLMKPMALFFLVLWAVQDLKTLKTATVLIMVAVVAVSLMAMWEYMDRAGSSFDRSRVKGITNQSNMLGAFFVSYMFLLFSAFAMSVKRWQGWVWLLGFLFAIRGMMVTFSRGAYTAFVAGMLVASWFRSKILFGIILFAGILMFTNPSLMPAGVRYRLDMTVKEDAPIRIDSQQEIEQSLETSSATRVTIWRGAVAMIKDRPWMGVGFGAFPLFIPHYTQGRVGYRDAHNAYLLIAAESGIPAAALFVLILAMLALYAIWLYRRSDDPDIRMLALGLVAGIVGLAVANMFSWCMNAEEVTGYLWILSGLVMRAVIMEKEKRAVTSDN